MVCVALCHKSLAATPPAASALIPCPHPAACRLQGMLQDCVHSCAVGRPLYPALLSLWGDDKEAYGSLNTTEHEVGGGGGRREEGGDAGVCAVHKACCAHGVCHAI